MPGIAIPADFGVGSSPRCRTDRPHYIELYLQGRLKPEELVPKRIKLEQLDEGFADLKGGNVARTAIGFG